MADMGIDFVAIMDRYGDVMAKYATATKELEALQTEIARLEKEKAELEGIARRQKILTEMLSNDNARLLKWAGDIQEAVLKFCAEHNLKAPVPVQPPVSITIQGGVQAELKGDVTMPNPAIDAYIKNEGINIQHMEHL